MASAPACGNAKGMGNRQNGRHGPKEAMGGAVGAIAHGTGVGDEQERTEGRGERLWWSGGALPRMLRS